MKKTENYDREEEEVENGEFEIDEGIIPNQSQQSKHKRESGVIFILEKASLEVGKVRKVTPITLFNSLLFLISLIFSSLSLSQQTYQLLNSDNHSNFLKNNNKHKRDYRPNIVHQALLAILDSTLNKAGRLKGLYVRTEKGVLIEVKPCTHLPRTLKSFYGLMSQLLQNLSIKDKTGRIKLLRVIRNPVTQYLPVNSHKIGFSFSSEKLVQMKDYVPNIESDRDIVFVVCTKFSVNFFNKSFI
ncbi:uncharacterized protein LOC133803615 [Humulus lupulus]|uniref:uncharacterized protein LOC133803615 n=1 Tax=Humulus lupulus TaxID=3486 RepID=UPI002B4167F4|nr:uncharacterized protein LOC133803615 [Humulus lupulus]